MSCTKYILKLGRTASWLFVGQSLASLYKCMGCYSAKTQVDPYSDFWNCFSVHHPLPWKCALLPAALVSFMLILSQCYLGSLYLYCIQNVSLGKNWSHTEFTSVSLFSGITVRGCLLFNVSKTVILKFLSNFLGFCCCCFLWKEGKSISCYSITDKTILTTLTIQLKDIRCFLWGAIWVLLTCR